MNWFKRIFCSQDEFNVHANGLPIAKLPKADKDISEPVISFVNCVRNNPKRFKVVYEFEYTRLRLTYDKSKTFVGECGLPETYTYAFKDTKTGESWTLCGGTTWPRVYLTPVKNQTDNSEWLTKDERYYLITEIKNIMKDRKGRKEKLQSLRKERKNRDERNRLKEIYQ